jgi:hypothetical protein
MEDERWLPKTTSYEDFRREYMNEPFTDYAEPVLIITPTEVILGFHDRPGYTREQRQFHDPLRSYRGGDHIWTLRVRVDRHFGKYETIYSKGMGSATGMTTSLAAQRAIYMLHRHLPKTMLDFIANLNEPQGLFNIGGLARQFKDWWYR